MLKFELAVKGLCLPQASQTISMSGNLTQTYSFSPMKKKCQFCSCEVVTYVEQEANPFFGLCALFILVIFGLLSFIILPLLYMITLNAVHRCSRCLQTLGQKNCIGMPDDFSEPVSIQIHNPIRYGTFAWVNVSWSHPASTLSSALHYSPSDHALTSTCAQATPSITTHCSTTTSRV